MDKFLFRQTKDGSWFGVGDFKDEETAITWCQENLPDGEAFKIIDEPFVTDGKNWAKVLERAELHIVVKANLERMS